MENGDMSNQTDKGAKNQVPAKDNCDPGRTDQGYLVMPPNPNANDDCSPERTEPSYRVSNLQGSEP